jgi:hypothetical protein
VTREERVVVRDDPVVDPHHAAVPDGVVVREDRRVALREVANVNEDLADRVGQGDRVDQRAGARLLLVHGNRVAQAIRVSGSVGAALCDSGK